MRSYSIALLAVVLVLQGIPVAQTPASSTSTQAKTKTSAKKSVSRASVTAAKAAEAPAISPDVLVALNIDSGVYHCAGSSKFEQHKVRTMAQRDALAKGYRPAFGKYCR